MKKRIFTAVLALVLVALPLLSCGGGAKDSGWNRDPYEALKAVTEGLTTKDLPEGGALYDSKVTDEETEGYMDEYLLLEAFKDASGKADLTVAESFALYRPDSRKATNIGIIKARSVEDIKAVEELVKNLISNVQRKFTSYIPEEDAVAKKTLVKTDGLYVYYVIALNTNKIGDMIEAEMAK